MSFVSSDDLKRWLDARGPAVSIYMPTHRAGREQQQDPIRLRNLLSDAERKLTALGLRSPRAQERLAPATRLLDQSFFWQHQRDGLALLLSESSFDAVRAPLRFEPLVTVGERLHIKPLLPLIGADAHFYVLALSQQEIRLLEGTRHTIESVELDQVPQSLAEALRWDDPETTLQWHSGAASQQGGRRLAMFYGHGADNGTEQKDQIRRYLNRVSAGIDAILAEERAPLVLAGVDYVLPIYREVSSYAHIVEGGILGNPEELSEQALHRAAWNLVEPLLTAERRQALERYRMLAGRGSELASDDQQEIVLAAHDGRVQTLLIAPDQQVWGRFDAQERRVEPLTADTPGALDLIDLAVAETLQKGGDVYLCSAEELSADTGIAAVLRH